MQKIELVQTAHIDIDIIDSVCYTDNVGVYIALFFVGIYFEKSVLQCYTVYTVATVLSIGF